jgi:hypothetical protein
MSISERTSLRRPSLEAPRFGEMTRLGLIALAIVVVHIVAATLMLPAASRDSIAPLENAKASFTD